MSTEIDAWEDRLNTLRPSPLPAPVRRHILYEMERAPRRGRPIFRALDHQRHAVIQVAIAAALFVALVAGWNWLPRSSRPSHRSHTAELAASAALLPSLATWGTTLAGVYPVGENSVAVLRSPSILTNIQIRH
jgi:hypothetical protein